MPARKLATLFGAAGAMAAAGYFFTARLAPPATLENSLGLAMLAGRFLIKVPVLAIAGSLAAKKAIPASAGTLPTHTPLFVAMLVAVVLLVGALTFLPALALGPIAEQLALGAF